MFMSFVLFLSNIDRSKAFSPSSIIDISRRFLQRIACANNFVVSDKELFMTETQLNPRLKKIIFFFNFQSIHMQIKSGDERRLCLYTTHSSNEEIDHKNFDVYIKSPLLPHIQKPSLLFFLFNSSKQTMENVERDASKTNAEAEKTTSTWFIEHDNGKCINY